jgi:hypothetical protein
LTEGGGFDDDIVDRGADDGEEPGPAIDNDLVANDNRRGFCCGIDDNDLHAIHVLGWIARAAGGGGGADDAQDEEDSGHKCDE